MTSDLLEWFNRLAMLKGYALRDCLIGVDESRGCVIERCVTFFHHWPTDCQCHLPDSPDYSDRLVACDDLGCVRLGPVQDRQENRKGVRSKDVTETVSTITEEGIYRKNA
ncbi:MAG: hypothetical protein LBP99_00070 [Azoarcus sp.]|jgi:hypothetical protein|nr:hypothetical protein [Azoarcus sp.]